MENHYDCFILLLVIFFNEIQVSFNWPGQAQVETLEWNYCPSWGGGGGGGRSISSISRVILSKSLPFPRLVVGWGFTLTGALFICDQNINELKKHVIHSTN